MSYGTIQHTLTFMPSTIPLQGGTPRGSLFMATPDSISKIPNMQISPAPKFPQNYPTCGNQICKFPQHQNSPTCRTHSTEQTNGFTVIRAISSTKRKHTMSARITGTEHSQRETE